MVIGYHMTTWKMFITLPETSFMYNFFLKHDGHGGKSPRCVPGAQETISWLPKKCAQQKNCPLNTPKGKEIKIKKSVSFTLTCKVRSPTPFYV